MQYCTESRGRRRAYYDRDEGNKQQQQRNTVIPTTPIYQRRTNKDAYYSAAGVIYHPQNQHDVSSISLPKPSLSIIIHSQMIGRCSWVGGRLNGWRSNSFRRRHQNRIRNFPFRNGTKTRGFQRRERVEEQGRLSAQRIVLIYDHKTINSSQSDSAG